VRQVVLSALFAAAIAGLITHLLVPVTVRMATALQALDRPDERRRHHGIVPRMGGMAIAGGLALGAGGVAVMQWGPWVEQIGRSELVALAVGIVMIFLTGFVDDLLGVSSLQKLFIEIAAALLLVWVGWTFTAISFPGGHSVEIGPFGQVVAVIWIVGVTNAINLLDGLDGLASGVVAIIAASFLVFAVIQGNMLSTILMGATCGASLGFLRHNWSPAKIYLGDSGSLTLGFVLAVTSVHSSLKAPAVVAILVPVLALGVPVTDTLLVMLVRFLERPKGRIAERFVRMFVADRNHLHYVLESLAAHRQRIVGWIYALVLLFCALAVVVAITRNATIGVVVLIVEVLVVVVVRQAGLRARARVQGDKDRRILTGEFPALGSDGAGAQPPLPKGSS
jgi:UDP-GlcNAc:undecaprenyl-phosphate GlcNAc-1-phosphate transferase